MTEKMPDFLRFMTEGARSQFERQLEGMGLDARAAFLVAAQSAFEEPPARHLGFDGEECNKATPGARRWKVVLDGYSYYTCNHPDPHIDVVA